MTKAGSVITGLTAQQLSAGRGIDPARDENADLYLFAGE
tara:strand:- start:105 stop:221 length:117 start_codon:yes stop_codon:yes gene_type:complete